ncbi:transporter substrate-binding domain-containing protein [Leisingera daeponensis]|uniref:transporter substrate-binding domain-containing protein n=1 Tax=Leisingera daeponensis TaxID=405746 RepID=UPI001C955568|nr:transporter substrate-binding domain-containing protein [Leisingera daeponensis]MBY6058138.1 transporter substrate-binding domain-containing protein [Leisingera daeponensis]
MKTFFAAAAIGLSGLFAAPAAADTCGGIYTVQSGDSLSVIADKLYKDAGKWSAIHNRNIDQIGPKPEAIRVGMKLSLACLEGLPLGLPGGREITAAAPAAAVPVRVAPGNAAVRQKINLLTGDDYAPFTSKAAHNGGLITEVVNAAMAKAAPSEGYAIHWVNDWSSHFDPLLSNALLDLGFPWYKPDCETMPDSYRCQNFHFSEPMFETLMLLFAHKDRPFTFAQDSDIEGKTLCRPAGYLTFDLDERGRDWIAEKKITLKQPHKVKDCFDMVASGEADAVAINEFTGRSVMKEAGIAEQFTVLPQPLSVLGIYVVVHKTHPRADEMLAMINKGLRSIQENGSYQTIVEDHMARIWAGF